MCILINAITRSLALIVVILLIAVAFVGVYISLGHNTTTSTTSSILTSSSCGSLSPSCTTISSTSLASSITNTKLKHVIFIIQENHSFDNYFGTFPGVNGLSSAPPCCPSSLAIADSPLIKPFPLGGLTNISIIGDELPPGVAYPDDAMGNTIVPLIVTTTQGPYNFNNESVSSCCSHAWLTAHTAYDNGKMDGFVSAEGNIQTMGYYDNHEIPNYWTYAKDFVLDDNFFSSLMGPSGPNHLMIASGQSPNQLENPGPGNSAPTLNQPDCQDR